MDDFNRANETYEIELIPATDDWSSDRLRIQAELTEHPSDLYAGFLDELPLNGQAFVDLKPWLEADGETGPALVPSVRDRLCREGACYALPYEFSLRTWLGERALFDHAGVTVEELDEIVAASGYDYALDGSYSDAGQLAFLAQYAPEFYVDVTNGTCSFTSDAFIRMLELCGQAGAQQADSSVPDAAVFSIPIPARCG